MTNHSSRSMTEADYGPLSPQNGETLKIQAADSSIDLMKIKLIDLHERLWAAEDIVNTARELIKAFDGLKSLEPVENLRSHFEGLRIVLDQHNELIMNDGKQPTD